MRRRLTAAALLLVTGALLAFTVPVVRYIQRVELSRYTSVLQSDAFLMAAHSEETLENLANGQTPPEQTVIDLGKVLDEYGSTSGARVIITDPTGRIIASTNLNESVGSDYSTRPEIQRAMKGEVAVGRRFSTTLNYELLYVAVPVLHGDSVYGTVRMTFPASVVDKAVQQRVRSIELASLATLLLAALLSWLIGSAMSRRVIALRDVTERFSAGQYAARADEQSGAPEERELAASFNAMAQRIGDLIEQQRAFSGDASHQLRTPLTALQLRLERAAELVHSDPQGALERIEAAMTETDRMQQLVEGLLMLSRADAKTVADVVTVDAAEIAAERSAAWEPLAEEREVSITYVGPQSARVRALPGALEQIIDNYLDNALHVAPANSRIEIHLNAIGDRTVIHVLDRGPGMSDEDLARAFHRLWRGRSDASGAGLGLAIVEKLAVASGGRVALAHRVGGGIDAIVELTNAD